MTAGSRRGERGAKGQQVSWRNRSVGWGDRGQIVPGRTCHGSDRDRAIERREVSAVSARKSQQANIGELPMSRDERGHEDRFVYLEHHASDVSDVDTAPAGVAAVGGAARQPRYYFWYVNPNPNGNSGSYCASPMLIGTCAMPRGQLMGSLPVGA